MILSPDFLPVVLNRIYPVLCRCPECTSEETTRRGCSRRKGCEARQWGCNVCGFVFDVNPTGVWVDTGGLQSELFAWPFTAAQRRMSALAISPADGSNRGTGANHAAS